MKILLVSNSVDGGAGKACLRLFYALRTNGQDAKILHLEGRASVDPNISSLYASVRELFMRQIKMSPVKVMRHIILGDYRRQYRLPSSIHRVKDHPLIEWADVINLHWVPEFIDYRDFFRQVGNKPVVWTMHDMLPFAGGYHYEMETPHCRKPYTEERIARIKRTAIGGSDLTVVAPSKWLLTESVKHETFSEYPHRHIFNGLPMEVYKPIDRKFARMVLDLPQETKIVLFAAHRLDSLRKGSIHIEAVLSRVSHSDVLFVSVGSRGMESHVGENYRHLGYLADDVSMALCYASADVVAVPSLEDNSPNIIIESMACGRPVVAFNVGGVGELIDRSELGILIEDISESAFETAIRKALNSDFDVNIIRTHAEARFSYDVLAKEYTRVFKASLNK
jgi:glycosyltransferase involved in cell wall biosynthesis